MTIQDAITDIKADLLAGTHAGDAVMFAAREYELNPVLVVRKFTEQTGVTPADFAETHRTRTEAAEIGVAASHADALERAIKQARNSVTAFNFDCDPLYRLATRLSEDAVGKTFTDRGELYVFAGLRGGASRWPFSGVRVSDGETFRFTNNHSAIVGQL